MMLRTIVVLEIDTTNRRHPPAHPPPPNEIKNLHIPLRICHSGKAPTKRLLPPPLHLFAGESGAGRTPPTPPHLRRPHAPRCEWGPRRRLVPGHVEDHILHKRTHHSTARDRQQTNSAILQREESQSDALRGGRTANNARRRSHRRPCLPRSRQYGTKVCIKERKRRQKIPI